MTMTKKELQIAKEMCPNLEKETTRTLERMLLDIRQGDWSKYGDGMILEHEYIYHILIKREREKTDE